MDLPEKVKGFFPFGQDSCRLGGLQFISQYFNMVFLNEFMPGNLFSEDFAVSIVEGAMGTEGTRWQGL